MIVTINTDASYVHQHQKGSYAFWIVSNSGRICKSGVLKGKMKCPVRSELKAIVNAVYYLVKKSCWTDINKVVLNTDCMNAIHLLKNDTQAIKRWGLGKKKVELSTDINMFNQFTKQRNIAVEFRHVKSHDGTDNARKYVNDWCDKEAKKKLWDWINKELEKNGKETKQIT